VAFWVLSRQGRGASVQDPASITTCRHLTGYSRLAAEAAAVGNGPFPWSLAAFENRSERVWPLPRRVHSVPRQWTACVSSRLRGWACRRHSSKGNVDWRVAGVLAAGVRLSI